MKSVDWSFEQWTITVCRAKELVVYPVNHRGPPKVLELWVNTDRFAC